MSNPLVDVIPANVRRYVYAAYFLAGVIVAALAVAGVGVGKSPEVLAVIGPALGAVAYSNTPASFAKVNKRPFEEPN